MIEIRSPKTKIEWDAYYQLRFDLLRKPLNQLKGSEQNDGDKTGIHFAFFYNNEIIGVARLDNVDSLSQQIRFFGVNNTFQKKGIGKQLLEKMEDYSHSKGFEKIILQSRENAVPFYKKNGYSILEKTHLLFGEIQHYLMEKSL